MIASSHLGTYGKWRVFSLFLLSGWLSSPTVVDANDGGADDGGSLGSRIEAFRDRQRSGVIGDSLDERVAGPAASIGKRSRAQAGEHGNWTLIDAFSKSSDARGSRDDLSTMGLRDDQTHGRSVSGWLPNSAIAGLSGIESLQFVVIGEPTSRSAGIGSKGGEAILADVARRQFDVTGEGVTVGVISDSFDCLGGAGSDRASGELPDAVRVLEETIDCEGRTDEGRALMQIVHDIAPGAALAFHAGTNGVASFANGILELATVAGADVIVDDSSPSYDLFFQDGLIVQAIDRAVDMGVTYVTAAGNDGRLSYEARYDEYSNSELGVRAHDFAGGDDVDVFQKLTVEAGTSVDIVLQWDEPAFSASGPPGTRRDLDIFITDASGTRILAGSAVDNIGKDPVELLNFDNPADSGQTDFNVLITNPGIDSPTFVKYVISGRFSGRIEEYSTDSSSIAGHSNALEAISVGAADYLETPPFGTSPPVLQFFSGAGGTKLRFSSAGERLETPELRQKPDIVGPDNVNTSFFNGDDTDNDGYPNFVGTSAAAPHVAGVAALLLEGNPLLPPREIKRILLDTAVDMGARRAIVAVADTGFDFDSGYGLVDAFGALELAGSVDVGELDAGEFDDSSVDSGEVYVDREAFGGAGSFGLLLTTVLASLSSCRIRPSSRGSAAVPRDG